MLGGAASVAGGGEFANGAITGAFGYLFDACHRSSRVHEMGSIIWYIERIAALGRGGWSKCFKTSTIHH